ncbi:MAG: nucleoside kinase [Eubacteriales bacterium]|nr:nucleoside kinase [Eubacteriales bacterium]
MIDNYYKLENSRNNYARTAELIMLKTFDDIVGAENIEKIVFEFSMNGNYFIYPNFTPSFRSVLTKEKWQEIIRKAWMKMHDYIEADLPITKKVVKVDTAINMFRERGMDDIAKLLGFRRTSKVTLSCFEGYETYLYGSVASSSGAIKSFDLHPYRNGFFLMLPEPDDPDAVLDIDIVDNLFNAQAEAYKMAHTFDCENVADLNEHICQGRTTELILSSESIFDNKLNHIAMDIINSGKKFVLLAGPSSSGKTSTAFRLSFALRSYGILPRVISADNYYLDYAKRRLDENGNPDFESLYALDLELFNSDMNRLINGESVELPYYNFKTGRREYHGDCITLGDRNILIIEGIHCLNEQFSSSIPSDKKYKVCVSALPALNIDEHNRITSTDLRLIRRLVRDERSRAHGASLTLQRWPDVRKGEENNIFPFTGEADAILNTAIAYELAAIKPYAERILFGVPRDSDEYFKAKELLKILDFVIPISTELIPPYSIVREFIGGSCLDVG